MEHSLNSWARGKMYRAERRLCKGDLTGTHPQQDSRPTARVRPGAEPSDGTAPLPLGVNLEFPDRNRGYHPFIPLFSPPQAPSVVSFYMCSDGGQPLMKGVLRCPVAIAATTCLCVA